MGLLSDRCTDVESFVGAAGLEWKKGPRIFYGGMSSYSYLGLYQTVIQALVVLTSFYCQRLSCETLRLFDLLSGHFDFNVAQHIDCIYTSFFRYEI